MYLQNIYIIENLSYVPHEVLDTTQHHNSQEHYRYSVISIFLLNSFKKGEGVRGYDSPFFVII